MISIFLYFRNSRVLQNMKLSSLSFSFSSGKKHKLFLLTLITVGVKGHVPPYLSCSLLGIYIIYFLYFVRVFQNQESIFSFIFSLDAIVSFV
jgi:hypothetical protein